MNLELITKVVIFASAFCIGATFVYRRSRGGRGRAMPRARAASAAAPCASASAPAPRPASQIPVRSFEAVVEETATERLIESIERRTRLTHNNFERDCIPVLRSFAEFVQFLPASECHHHAQPGGLWIHALEVVDAALTFRAGLEMPLGASTEERKRQEHRWTYAVFVAALLHDVGKPVTEVRVTLFGPDPRAGQAWAPMAGPMRAFAAHYYSVAFIDPDARDYVAHTKLGAMLLHKFVPERVMRWLGEDAGLLTQLVAYLSGDDPDGALGSIVKRADSDSVRRNLLQGPRTRFASARTVPLIERLMRALRRMLAEGALPLNRPGAAGWVHDGKLWFVCARAADEVRAYLAQHESAQGIPGKDRNDRLFDTWQEFGAALTAPDGGAVWRAHVQCDNWSPPEPFTLLCFRLQSLYADASQFPAPMRGQVTPVDSMRSDRAVAPVTHLAAAAPSASRQRIEPWLEPSEAPPPVPVAAAAAELSRSTLSAFSAGTPAATHRDASPGDSATAIDPSTLRGRQSGQAAPRSVEAPPTANEALVQTPPAIDLVQPATAALGAERLTGKPASSGNRATGNEISNADTETLSGADQALAEFQRALHTETPRLTEPIQPRQRGLRPGEAGAAPAVAAAAKPAPAALGSAAAAQAGTRPGSKGPTPAAAAFMAWVAHAVGTGELSYNEDGALVHFAQEGALLLSPEIFRRFFNAHASVADGPIAALRQSHGDRAFARLQNELAKSGWTARNGDENLHYYAFLKADGTPSRTASFYLVRQPGLFWSPVPGPNQRIRPAPRPKKMKLPGGAGSDPPAKRPTALSAEPEVRA